MRTPYRLILIVSLVGVLNLFLPLDVTAQSSYTRVTPLSQESYQQLEVAKRAVTLLLIKIGAAVSVVGFSLAALLYLGLFKKTQRFSRDSAFVAGWSIIRDYKWLLAGLFAIQQTSGIVVLFMTDQFFRLLVRQFYNATFAWTLFGFQRALAVLVGSYIFLFTMNVMLAIHGQRFGGIGEWRKYLPTVKAFFFFIVAVIFSWLAILGGALLLVIPGIIAFVALQFYPMLLLDGKARGPLQALKMSAAMTRGCRFDLFLLLFLLGALNVAGFLVFFVGLLVTIPLSLLVLIDVYRQLSPATTSSQPLPAQFATKSRITRSNA